MKVLIIFGSKSDQSVYNNLVETLKQANVHYEMRICSAHRTPDELMEILHSDADIIIAGAGLAAHLPGVIASKVIQPIIGVPVSGNYQGLDALLSIMQMPPGIPVLSVGVEKTDVAGNMAAKMNSEFKEVNLFFQDENKAVKKAKETLDEFQVPYTDNPDFKASSLNIKFVTLDEQAENRDDIIIYVPLLDKDDDKAEASLNVLKNSTNGLWVGLNRGENAALAAIQIMNIKGHYTEQINEYRKKHALKVIEADNEVKEHL